MVTLTMTSLSSCWTLSFLSLVPVIKILCVLGLVPLGSTRNTGMPHLTFESKCLVLSHNLFVLSISAIFKDLFKVLYVLQTKYLVLTLFELYKRQRLF